MTATEDTPPLQADLPDILRLVAELATVQPMGRRGRQILMALHVAGLDVEKMDGLVIEGEVYNARWRQEYAVCHCGDDKHEFRRDAPPGRGHWHGTKHDAQSLLNEAIARWEAWTPNRPKPHLATHLVASTGTERVA